MRRLVVRWLCALVTFLDGRPCGLQHAGYTNERGVCWSLMLPACSSTFDGRRRDFSLLADEQFSTNVDQPYGNGASSSSQGKTRFGV